MMKYLLVVLFLNLLSSCASQTNIKIYIENKSSSEIDSIVFPEFPQYNSKTLSIGQSKTINTSIIFETNEGALGIYIWQQGKKRLSHWGVHDWGRSLTKGNDTVIVTDHYITNNSLPIKKPNIFALYVTDSTNNTLDSLYFGNGILLNKGPWKEKMMVYNLDYAHFEKSPICYALINKKFKEIRIQRDWTIWENPFTGIVLWSDGTVTELN